MPFAILAMVVILVAVPTSAARAAVSQCTGGQVCLWQHLTYSGYYFGDPGDVRFLEYKKWNDSSPWHIVTNEATSAASMGTRCRVRLYDKADKKGAYIELAVPGGSRSSRDPDLRNGGGSGAWSQEDWNDRISSIHWVC